MEIARVCKIDSAAGGTVRAAAFPTTRSPVEWQGQGGCKGKEDQATELPKERTGEDCRRVGKLVVKKNLGATWAQNYAQVGHFRNGQMV
jgi:hypothetical protein